MAEDAERRYVAYYDGACEPENPGGHLGFGAVVIDPEGDAIFTYSKFVHSSSLEEGTSNNVAEYMAIIELMKFLIEENLAGEKIVVYGDNKMSVNQMLGLWKCRAEIYEKYYREAIRLKGMFSDISFLWIPREENAFADGLSKREILNNGYTVRSKNT